MVLKEEGEYVFIRYYNKPKYNVNGYLDIGFFNSISY